MTSIPNSLKYFPGSSLYGLGPLLVLEKSKEYTYIVYFFLHNDGISQKLPRVAIIHILRPRFILKILTTVNKSLL